MHTQMWVFFFWKRNFSYLTVQVAYQICFSVQLFHTCGSKHIDKWYINVLIWPSLSPSNISEEPNNIFPPLSLFAHFSLVGRDWLIITFLYTSSQNITLEKFLRSHLLSWISRCPYLWIPIPILWEIVSCWPTWVWFGCQNLTPVNEAIGVEGRGRGKWQLTEKWCHWELGIKWVAYLFKVSN